MKPLIVFSVVVTMSFILLCSAQGDRAGDGGRGGGYGYGYSGGNGGAGSYAGYGAYGSAGQPGAPGGFGGNGGYGGAYGGQPGAPGGYGYGYRGGYNDYGYIRNHARTSTTPHIKLTICFVISSLWLLKTLNM